MSRPNWIEQSPSLQHPTKLRENWTDEARFDFDYRVRGLEMTDEASAQRTEWVREFIAKERENYLRGYALKEIATEFPDWKSVVQRCAQKLPT